MLRGLDLFSGIGGLSLALEPWVQTVCYCEIDPYAQRVIIERMRDGGLHLAPIWDDVRTLQAQHTGPVDIIFGGFPCQDVSLAGKRAGLDGERSGLYREVIRLVGSVRPTFVFLENVAAIRGHAWRVVEDLARLGFDCRWTNLSAAEVGAPHRRDRWWLLASNADSQSIQFQHGRLSGESGSGTLELKRHGATRSLANANERGRFGHEGDNDLGFYWATEPDVGRVANGIPNRLDKLRCLGNAVVPAQARAAFKHLSGL